MKKIIAQIIIILIFACMRHLVGFEITVVAMLSVLILNQKTDND